MLPEMRGVAEFNVALTSPADAGVNLLLLQKAQCRVDLFLGVSAPK